MEMTRSSGTRGVVVVAVVAVLAVLAFRCTRTGDAPDWLPRYSGGVSGDDATLAGTIYREGNCLYVGTAERRWLPIFPKDTSFDEKTGKLNVRGRSFRVGGQFRSGGGESHGVRFIEDDLIHPLDPSCDITLMWIVGDT